MTERGYRRLLWAYPRWYRRTRGDEILTTLLEARSDTPVRDALDVIGGGLRCRLRVRGGGARFIALLVALFAGVGGSGLAAAAAWEYGHAVPTNAEALAAATLAMPDAAATAPTGALRCDIQCAGAVDYAITRYDKAALDLNWGMFDPPASGADPSMERVVVPLTAPYERVPDLLTQARQRLAAAGWRLGPAPRYEYGDAIRFWATKGDVTIELIGNGPIASTGPAIWVTLYHRSPPLTGPAAIAGFLAGLLLGWLAAARGIRRYRAHGVVVRFAMAAATVPGLSATVFLLLATVLGVGALASAGGWNTQDWLVSAAVMRVMSWPTILATGALTAAFALSFVPARRRPSGQIERGRESFVA